MKTSRRLSWLLLAALSGSALITAPAFAKSVAAFGSKPDKKLPASPTRYGLGMSFAEASVALWACQDDPCSRPEHASYLKVPEEVAKKKPRVAILEGAGEYLWWVRYGDDAKFYSFVIAGSKKKDGGSASGAKVVLRGWAGSGENQKTKIVQEKRGAMDSLTIESGTRKIACGRSAAQVTRMVDPVRAKARRVRAPLLSRAEREGAKTIEAKPFVSKKDYLVGLERLNSGSAKKPLDGDLSGPWSSGFEYVDLQAPKGVSLKRLAISLASAAKQPVALYLATSSEVFQLVLPPQDDRTYLVDVPATTEGCVSLIQPKKAAPVSEIMGVVSTEDLPSAAHLVGQLERGDATLPLAALHVEPKAPSEIYDRFPKLSKLGRERAFEFARRSVPKRAAPIWIRGAMSDDERQVEESLAALEAMGSTGIKVTEAALAGYKGAGRERLVRTLKELSSERAVQLFPSLFEGATPSMRDALRGALGALQSEEEEALMKLVGEIADGKSKLPKRSQIELARALGAGGPVLQTDEGKSWIASLSSKAKFRDAYLLAPGVLALTESSAGLKETYGKWLVGESAGKLSEQQRAALSVRLMELLVDRDERAKYNYGKRIAQLLSAENMRVRRSALIAVNALGLRISRDQAEEMLVDDPWPQVRAMAAPALVETVDQPDTDPGLGKLLVRRLAKDRHHTVRRSVARTLVSVPGERTLKGLRKAYQKDEDYSVRAEAAVSLGKLCDRDSVEGLTRTARLLSTGLTDDGAIELGLSSVTALAHLAPEDLDERLAPLMSDEMAGITRQQVKRRIEAVETSKQGPVCKRSKQR